MGEVVFTGERPVPGLTPDDVFRPAIARYLLAAEVLPGKTGLRGLDVGCGTGIGSGFLASKGHLVVGLDVDRESLAWGNRSGLHPALRLVRASGESLPFARGAFDWVTAFEAAEHMRSPEAFAAEVHRVLRPGGAFLCSVPHCLNEVLSETLHDRTNPFHVQRFTSRTMRQLLSARFEVQSEWGQRYRSIPHYLYVLSRFLAWSTILRTPVLGAAGRLFRRWRDRPEAHAADRVDGRLQTRHNRWKYDGLPAADRPTAAAPGPRLIPETMIFLCRKSPEEP